MVGSGVIKSAAIDSIADIFIDGDKKLLSHVRCESTIKIVAHGSGNINVLQLCLEFMNILAPDN